MWSLKLSLNDLTVLVPNFPQLFVWSSRLKTTISLIFLFENSVSLSNLSSARTFLMVALIFSICGFCTVFSFSLFAVYSHSYVPTVPHVKRGIKRVM